MLIRPDWAAVAQLVEHIIRNDGVGGSNPFSGTKSSSEMAETSERPVIQGVLEVCCPVPSCKAHRNTPKFGRIIAGNGATKKRRQPQRATKRRYDSNAEAPP